MAGKKQGTPGEKQPGEIQLFGKGARATRLLEEIQGYAASHGVSLEVAAERMLERWAADRTEGYARGVIAAEVVVVGQEGGPWPKEA